MTDSYTARDAARILGRSERLVRKLAADGRLEIVSSEPLRVSQESVHRERSRRKSSSATGSKAVAPQGILLDAEQLQRIIEQAVSAAISQTMSRALESRDAIEQRLAADLAEAQQRIDTLAAELEDERRRRKRWKRKKKR